MIRHAWVAYAALTLTALFWAGNTIVGRAVYHELPPMGLAFWRSFGAFLIIAPFGFAQVWRERRTILAHWRDLTLLGVLGMTAFSALVFVGLRHTQAVNGSLIQGTLPLNIILASLVLFGRMVTPRQGLGLIAGMVGFALIVLRGHLTEIGAVALNVGDALIWLGVFCHGLFSILLPRRPVALDLPAFLTVAFFIGAVTTLPLHLWEIAEGNGMPATWTAVWASAFVALFPSVLAQFLWVAAIARVGATTAGYFIYLTPVFGAAIAVALLGEMIAWYHGAGIAFIFAGIWLATTGSAKAAEKPSG
jgi:drug/metabolite transporter (DMT)-like permease